jgi:hypothetical protein
MSNRNSGQPADSKQRRATGSRHLVFRVAPHMDSLVFTSLDRAIEIDRLHRGIETSTTWGEFRKRIGPEEYAEFSRESFYTPQPDDDPEDIDESEREPSDDAPFRSDFVPGFCDGDYPPWLAQEMHRHVPREILNQFARENSSVLNGPFWEIELKDKDAMVKALWRCRRQCERSAPEPSHRSRRGSPFSGRRECRRRLRTGECHGDLEAAPGNPARANPSAQFRRFLARQIPNVDAGGGAKLHTQPCLSEQPADIVRAVSEAAVAKLALEKCVICAELQLCAGQKDQFHQGTVGAGRSRRPGLVNVHGLLRCRHPRAITFASRRLIGS